MDRARLRSYESLPSPTAQGAPRLAGTYDAPIKSPVADQFDLLTASFTSFPPLNEPKFSRRIRAAILIGGSAFIWAVIFGLSVIVVTHRG